MKVFKGQNLMDFGKEFAENVVCRQ